GRLWTGTDYGILELGNSHEKMMGPASLYNVTKYTVLSQEDFPILITNSLDVSISIYKSLLISLEFPSTVSNLSIPNNCFNYPINWGQWGYFYAEGNYKKHETNEVNPIAKHYDLHFDNENVTSNKIIDIELYSFGPSEEWSGRIIWIS
ncbi:MAG: hypothetical protein ACO3UU_11425, partial [Minisyncoccia bacterium]